MYTVKVWNMNATPTYIWDYRKSDNLMKSSTLDKELEAVDQFNFDLIDSDIKLKSFLSFVEVKNEVKNNVVFRGRIMTPTTQMNEDGTYNTSYTSEGAMAYLDDFNPSYNMLTDLTPQQRFRELINIHNSLLGADTYKRINIGNVSVTPKMPEPETAEYDDTAYFILDPEKSILTHIRELILGVYGGEIVLRYEADGNYIDWVDKIGSKKSTELKVGKNMKSFQRQIDPTEVITRLIPLGSSEPTAWEGSKRLEIIEDPRSGGKNYIDIPELIALYGIQTGVAIFDDEYTPDTLYDRGMKEKIEIMKKYAKMTTEIQLLDLFTIGLDPDDFERGNFYHTILPRYNIDEDLRVVGTSFDVIHPQNKSCRIGDKDLGILDVSDINTLNIINESVPTIINEQVTPIINNAVTEAQTIFDNTFESQKEEFENQINQVNINAEAKVEAAETRMTDEINNAKSTLSTSITNSYNNAVQTAQNKVDAAKAEMNKSITDAKTALTTDINNSYTKAVTDAEIKAKALDAVITQTVNANKQSADKTMGELNTVLNSTSNKVGTIEENVTAAQQNISTLNNTTNTQQLAINQAKQDISGLTATVGGHTSSITNIDGQLTTVKSDLDKHAGDIVSVKNATSSNTTDITNLNNQIKLTATKTEVTDAINGIEIGGTNLLENSMNISKRIDESFNNLTQLFRIDISHVSPKLKIGDIITISFDVQMETGTILKIYDANGQIDKSFGIEVFMGIGTDKQRLSYTKTVTNPTKPIKDWHMDFYNDIDPSNRFTIERVKIEKGNKATDWTPAPEDIESKITKNEASIQINNDEIAKRVLKTDYDIKTGQMQTQINTATSTANKNTQTIATINGEIDSVKQWQIDKGTTIEQTADAITQKVWNTDINKATGTIQQELNTVKQTANSNSATISSVKTTADSVNTWKTQKETAINQTIDAVTTKVWKSDIDPIAKRVATAETNISSNADAIKLSATKTEVQNAINNIEIGGRNLAVDSNNFYIWNKYNGANFVFDNGQTVSEWKTDKATNIVTAGSDYGAHVLKLYNNYMDGIIGQIYTVSIYIKNNNGNARILEVLGLDSLTGGTLRANIPPNSIGRYVLTGKKNASYTTIQTRILALAEPTYTNMTMYGFKIEKGNKATDWTPAPEDIESKVAKNEASIQINSDEIIKRVTKTEFNTKTGQIEQIANTAKSTADSNLQTITTVKGNVDALSQWKAAKGTAIDQTINSVTNKAWLTDINPITKRVETAEASITTNANEIAKRVTKTIYDADTKRIEGTANTAKSTAESNTATITTVSGRVGTLEKWRTDKGSQIDQAIDAVTTKVWQNDIDNLSFENRNLLLDSGNVQMTSNNASSYPIVNGVSSDGFKTVQRANVTSNPTTLSCYTQHFFPIYEVGTYTQQIKVRPTSDIYLSLYGGGNDVLCKANEWTTLYRYISITTVPADNRFRFMGLMSSTNDFTVNNPIIEYKESKVEFGSKATPYSIAPKDAENRMTEIKQTADGALTKATTIGNDYVKQSAVLVQPDGVLIGSKKVSGTEMASAISVTPSNVDIITKVMRVTGDMAVAGDIKTLSLQAVNADIANLRASILTADSVTANALKADAALIQKLNTNAILTNYLTADTAMINSIKSNAVTAVRGDIAWLKANVITADSITSTSLKVDTALIEKLNTNSILTNEIIADTAYINNVKTLSLEAVYADIANLKANIITADSISSTNIKSDLALVNKIFSQAAYISTLTSKAAFIRDINAISVTANSVIVNTMVDQIGKVYGGVTIRRPDGVPIISNGMLENEYLVTAYSPEFMSQTSQGMNAFYQSGAFWTTTPAIASDIGLANLNAYRFRHQARYLRIQVSVYTAGNYAAGGLIRIDEMGVTDGFTAYQTFNTGLVNAKHEFVIDLGKPTLKERAFYFKARAALTGTGEFKFRIMKVVQDDLIT